MRARDSTSRVCSGRNFPCRDRRRVLLILPGLLTCRLSIEKNVEATKFDFIRFWGVSRGLTLGKGDVLRLEPLGERWLVDEFLGPEMTARVKVLPEA